MRLAIFGDPVDHSLSPEIHEAALRAAGLAGVYVRYPVRADELPQAVARLGDGELAGANVTMPHKRAVLDHCDRLTATAWRTGAVNTLYRSGSDVVGHNTDVAGVSGAWSEADFPADAPVLILGAGGAAAAAVLALEHRNMSVAARDVGRADQLLTELGVDAAAVPWETAIEDHVVVNATPLGMHGESLPAPYLAGAIGLLDMVYGPDVSPAVAFCHERDITAVDGTRMLLHQAAAAFEIWTGHAAAMTAMSDALSAGKN